MRPWDVASKSKERCDLAYAVLKFDLIPTSHYSRRTKEHCRTTVAAEEVGSLPGLSAAVIMQLQPQGYGPRGTVPKAKV